MSVKFGVTSITTNQEWFSARWEMWSDNVDPPHLEMHGEYVGFGTSREKAIEAARLDFLTIGDGESDEDCEPVNTEYLNDR